MQSSDKALMKNNNDILKAIAGSLGITALTLVAVLVDLKTSSKDFEVPYRYEQAKPLSSLINHKKEISRAPASTKTQTEVSLLIPQGEIVYLDQSMNVDTLTIRGELHCDANRAGSIPITLRAKTIEVYGVFQCGTRFNPYKKKLTISLVDSQLDPVTNSGYRGLVVKNGGKWIMHGDRRNTAWRKLTKTAMPGDNFIEVQPEFIHRQATKESGLVSRSVQKFHRVNSLRETAKASMLPYTYQTKRWKVGDKIAIGPTGFDYAEAESFTITSVDANKNRIKLGLNNPIQHMHWGETQNFSSQSMGQVILDERAEVANLTRNIVIKADESNGPIDEGSGATAQRGGHTMVHPGGEAYIDSVEFYKLGQAGIMARYPFHWHWVGDAAGQYIKNSAIHHSFQRCVTVHRTHKTIVQNNVCYDFKGHGYFLEDGNEVENKIIHNLAIMAKAPSSNKILLQSDKVPGEGQGRFPSVSCFWISNPNNYVVGNVASGCVGSAIWMAFEKEVKDMNGNIIAEPLKEKTDTFNYNSAHSAKVGITWDGAPGWLNANNPNNPQDKILASAHYDPPSIPIFKGNRAWKNYYTGIYFRGQTVVYENTVLADNGWNVWVAYNQIIRDSVIIGKTNNTNQSMRDYYYSNGRADRRRPTGIILYDGPFEAHNVDFLNFSTSPETYTQTNGVSFDSTYVPFTSTGGSNKFTNLVSGLNFDPEPVYRAHMEDSQANANTRQYLANAAMRELDGSLSGSGQAGVVVAIRSMGVRPQDNCVDGGVSLTNFQVCGEHYTEGSTTFMRWNRGAWSTPFVVMRDDGKLSYPIEEWPGINTIKPNNLFATTNDSNTTYYLMPKYQWEQDRLPVNNPANPAMDANTESMNPNQPVIKIVGYGNNCRLKMNNGQIYQANSVSDLRMQNQTAYYSNGADFYVKLVPTVQWGPITIDPIVQATALATLTSDQRYPVECDPGYLDPAVIGKIQTVSYGADYTTVSGWACNFSKENSIQVKLYAWGPAIATQQNARQSKGALPVKYANVYTHIADEYSNQDPDGELAFKCGKMSTKGRKFTFVIPNGDLEEFGGKHKFAVKGISNSGGDDAWIERSKYYYVKRPIKKIPQRELSSEQVIQGY